MMKQRACSNCKFYQVTAANLSQGECRQESPRVTIMPGPRGEPMVAGAFPATKCDNWCGKFEQRQDA